MANSQLSLPRGARSSGPRASFSVGPTSTARIPRAWSTSGCLWGHDQPAWGIAVHRTGPAPDETTGRLAGTSSRRD